MPKQNFPRPPDATIPDGELLEGDEVLLIVDDFPDIVGLIRDFLEQCGYPSLTAGTAAELHHHVATRNVALILLDIGLPDADGTQLLPELKKSHADLAIIMLTGITDLKTALNCLRYGAEDYLTKPVHFTDLLTTVRKILEKRRLTIRNRQYQRQIEQANRRIQLAHRLAMKMNTAYLSIVELDEILKVMLVGITAEEGLQFNRAFLALFDEEGTTLEGRLAMGPGNREEGGRIWQGIAGQGLHLDALIAKVKGGIEHGDSEVNRIVQTLQVDATNGEHLLICAVRERRSINVVDGRCSGTVPLELLGLLQEDSFVVVPLYSPGRALGVIIADHFVTREPISDEQVRALESFASQASLAIDHCRLYMEMQEKIRELEEVTKVLETNKNLLIEAERYSAVGHMAAQLAHTIRNPITVIGGTARLLARRTEDRDLLQFLEMMSGEAKKIEEILENLFNFVDRVKPVCQRMGLSALIQKSMLLHFRGLEEKGIRRTLRLPKSDPEVEIDPQLIQQVLVHLIRNSIEAMPAGGELKIELLEEEKTVRIVISDTGSGSAELDLMHATDPFFTTKQVGTGVGLTMVKRIIEDHGGSLSLQNRAKGGVRATIALPKAG